MQEATRARTVRDMIPNSKLAQYANYEYNEAREMSYASQASDVSFYYPCLYKKDSKKEPWMLPEVEQTFIWLTYSKQFDLTKNMEELHCVGNNNNNNAFGDSSSYMELHEFKPIFFENFERTPGKARFTASNILTEDDYKMVTYHILSDMLSVESFDDMTLKMRIRSGISSRGCFAIYIYVMFQIK